MRITRQSETVVEVEEHGFLYEITHDTENYGDFFRSHRIEDHRHTLRKSLSLKDAIMQCQEDAAFHHRRAMFAKTKVWTEFDKPRVRTEGGSK